MGSLCLVFGAFILLLTLIPNTPRGRMCFIYCGGIVFISGWILYGLSVSKRRQKAEMVLETAADKT